MDKSSQIRSDFINFFKERGHTVVRSAPVIPVGDPTLLFTNAGMNQFKDVFLEQGGRPYKRAVDTQKCIRVSGKHNDLDIVGRSPSHHTFFEMLGNWSFGDYYKREAIEWAWELLTGVWKLEPSRIWPTVFEGNDEADRDMEAYQAWKEVSGLPDDQITFHPRKDNFWEMGDVGPCGPCSELHYDLGEDFCRQKHDPTHKCKVNGECGRIVELWNLVFMQYRRDEAGKLHPLPRRHVDTGAGFERIVTVLEGKKSNYETSLFRPLIVEVERISGVEYDAGESGVPHRIAADHVRSLSFAIADGVLPSNEGRGYVMRRILRRGARFGRTIGIEQPFIYQLVEPLAEIMGEAFPEIRARYKHIVGVIKAEEEGFARTLGRGLELFGGIVEKTQQASQSTISGDEVFKLYDTFGFPLDLTKLMAEEQNLTIDEPEFNRLMEEQRKRARGEAKFTAEGGEIEEGLHSEFTGYDYTEHTATVISVQKQKDGLDLILDRTPFYAESGGQVADWGEISNANGKLDVKNVFRKGDIIFHHGKWQGEALPVVGDEVWAKIDVNRRQEIRLNHTATHLLHTALRQHVGSHATQAGSLVAPDHLRFDFTHFEKLTDENIATVERMVNDAIRADFELDTTEEAYKDAIDSGVTALFGEKYGDRVRVVSIRDKDDAHSRELCGGTHVARTGELGMFRINYEGAVSAGVRRIEAVTGSYAYQSAVDERKTLNRMADLMGSHGSDPAEKLEKLLDEKRATEKELKTLVMSWAQNEAKYILQNAETIQDYKVAAKSYDGVEIDRLKIIGDATREMDAMSVILLTSSAANGAGQLCCVVGDKAISFGKLKAGALVGKAAKVAGGGGGGKPHMATAGTRTPEKLSDAVKEFPKIAQEILG